MRGIGERKEEEEKEEDGARGRLQRMEEQCKP